MPISEPTIFSYPEPHWSPVLSPGPPTALPSIEYGHSKGSHPRTQQPDPGYAAEIALRSVTCLAGPDPITATSGQGPAPRSAVHPSGRCREGAYVNASRRSTALSGLFAAQPSSSFP
jgi:hypothetical protein